MNQICVRTNTGDYVGGHTVFGCVYVCINGPTSGTGVRLCLKSFEEFKEFRGTELTKEKQGDVQWEVKLYDNNGKNLPRCQFMLPFQFKLNDDIPATFRMHTDTFSALLRHQLVAFLTGDDNIRDVAELVILHNLEDAKYNQPEGETSKLSYKSMLIFTKAVALNARFCKSSYLTGGVANVNLKITSSEPTNSFTVQLIRDLKITQLKKITSDDSEAPIDGDSQMSDDLVEKKIYQPEDGWSVVGEQIFEASEHVQLDQITSVAIPLTTTDGRDLPSSTCGKLIHCDYHVKVEVDVNGRDRLAVNVPLRLHMTNKEWLSWTPSPWVYHCDLKEASPLCSVPHRVLAGEHFAGMPGFQRL